MPFQETIKAICLTFKSELENATNSEKDKLIRNLDLRLHFEFLYHLYFNATAIAANADPSAKTLVIDQNLREDLNRTLVDVLILFSSGIKLNGFVTVLLNISDKSLFKNTSVKKLQKKQEMRNLLRSVKPSNSSSLTIRVANYTKFSYQIALYKNNFNEAFDCFKQAESLDIHELIRLLSDEIIRLNNKNLFPCLEYVLRHASQYGKDKEFYQNVTQISVVKPKVDNNNVDNNNNSSTKLPLSLLHIALLSPESNFLDFLLSKDFNLDIADIFTSAKISPYYFVFDYFLPNHSIFHKQKSKPNWLDDITTYYFQKLSRDNFCKLDLNNRYKVITRLFEKQLTQTLIFLINNDWLLHDDLALLPDVNYAITFREANLIKCPLVFSKLASLLCIIKDHASFTALYDALKKNNLLKPSDSENLLIYCTANSCSDAAIALINRNINFNFKYQNITSAFDIAILSGNVIVSSHILQICDPNFTDLKQAIHFTMNRMDALISQDANILINKIPIAAKMNAHSAILEMILSAYFKHNIPNRETMGKLQLTNADQIQLAYFYAVITLQSDDEKLSGLLESYPLPEKRLLPNRFFIAKLHHFGDIKPLSIILQYTDFKDISEDDLTLFVQSIFLWTIKSNEHFEFTKSLMNTLINLSQKRSFDTKQTQLVQLFVKVLCTIASYEKIDNSSLRPILSQHMPSHMITCTKPSMIFSAIKSESTPPIIANLKELASLLINLNINFEAPVETIDNIECSPLVYACFSGATDIVEQILASNISLTHPYSQYAPRLAVHLGHQDIVKALLRYYETNSYFNESSLFTLFSLSLQNNHPEIFELLLIHMSSFNENTPITKKNIPSELLSILKKMYLLTDEKQTTTRQLIENYLPDNILEKLKSYDKPVFLIPPTETPPFLKQSTSPNKWRCFRFFDNGQPCYAKIDEKDYEELAKRDKGKQIESTFMPDTEQQRFGPRFKKINHDLIKMRFTGYLGSFRIFFEREKTPDTLKNEVAQRNPDNNSQESSDIAIFTATQFMKKH